MRYGKLYSTRRTSQSMPIPTAGQAVNSAGGFVWELDDWARLQRFLILGSEGGSYYASEQKLTVANAEAVRRCLEKDGIRVVRQIIQISDSGRAPKNDPALFALAMCAGLGNEETRRAALNALPLVARIGTHLFHFAQYVEGFRGWGRGLRQAVAKWYLEMPLDRLAYQAVKYQQRDRWSHRDMLRLAHPQTNEVTRNALFHWIVRGWQEVGDLPHPNEVLRTIWAFELLKQTTDPTEAACLISTYHLPMEAVPTGLRSREVWEALLPHAGLTFLIRNLGNLSKYQVVTKGSWTTNRYIRERLTDRNALQKERVHPVQILSALTTYQQGKGARGSGEWTVVPEIVDALNEAFYASFASVGSAGKRFVLALDVSGSMSWGNIAGVPGLTPRVASAAMAMVTCKTEPHVEVVAFCDKMLPLDLSRSQRLDDVLKAVDSLPFGATDCAQPILWALEKKVETDVFVIYTDSETWSGEIHPSQALRLYRQQMGIPARLIVVGMLANPFTIADPKDAGMLDVVGFDTAAPELMRQFAAGML